MLPNEIHRSIRSLNVFHCFKGTEFRTIVLYVGIVLLKDFLPTEEYDLFLILFCAITLCSSRAYSNKLSLARELFNEFIEGHINTYGLDTITSNIHNLNHVVDDVEMFGDLSTISAYEFENCLYEMKLLVRKCDKPLQQLSRRIIERSVTLKLKPFENNMMYPKAIQKSICTDNSDIIAFNKIEYKQNTILANDIKNQYVLTREGDIVRFKYAFERNGKHFICGHPQTSKENFFTKPILSSSINIFIAEKNENDAQIYELEDVKAKFFCLPYKNQHVYVPLLHTL